MDPIVARDLKWDNVDNLQPIQQFSGPQPGPTLNLTGPFNEVDIFNTSFDDIVWQKVTDYTNGYAAYVRQLNPQQHKSPWQPTSVDEMKAYIGMVIAMG